MVCRTFQSVGLCGLIVLLLTAVPWPAFSQAANEWESPEALYIRTCAYCHELGVGPYLKGRKLPAEYFKIRLRYGFRAMPAFKPSEISDKDADMLGKWLQESKAGKQVVKGAQFRSEEPE